MWDVLRDTRNIYNVYYRFVDADKLVRLDVTGMTPSMIVSSDHYEVYNGNWTFESATSTRSVCKSGQTKTDILGWYYEVTIFSKGIIQIGKFVLIFSTELIIQTVYVTPG